MIIALTLVTQETALNPRHVFLLALASFGAAPAAAHEFWLSPSTYRAAAGDTVAISAWVGTGFRGEVRPYAPSRASRFLLRANRMTDLTPLGRNGDTVMARFAAPDPGGALVAYESSFAEIQLPATEFDAYLSLEGLDGPRAARHRARSTAAVRERYARCPKTWIGGRDTTRVTQPTGLTFELVPLANPATRQTLTVQARFRGRPLAGALVRAWNRPLGERGRPFDPAARDSVGPFAEGRTNARGRVTLRIDRPGEWLVSAVHMVPSGDRRMADWESYWASLTFGREGR